MAGDLVLAVTDGPDGVEAIELPSNRWQAIEVRERHRNRFWCSTEAQGCGGQVLIAAGPILIPHFRHQKDARCSFIGHESKASPAYEHLRYQRAIQRWLATQGHDAVIEKTLGSDGRTDLHVVINSVRHSLEVQLSPLPSPAWRERDAKYRRHHDHVTWLYGPAAEAAGATELSLRGVAFSLRPGPSIGVRDFDAGTHWAELADCRLTDRGLEVPGLEAALALHQHRKAEAAEAQRRLEDEAAERQQAADAQREEWARQQAALRSERERRQPEMRAQQPLFKLNHDPALRGLERWEGLYPEAAAWAPEVGWDWLDQLPVDLWRRARALAYCTQVLCAAAPTRQLLAGVLLDEERTLILSLLEQLGLITLDWPHPELERFERSSRRQASPSYGADTSRSV